MKPKPSADKVNFSGPLPTREQLAMHAVASQRKNPADAVRHAIAVWREARVALRETTDAQSRNKLSDVPLPKAFPAPLSEFARLVVDRKTQKQGKALWRRFRNGQFDEQRVAGSTFRVVGKHGFQFQQDWVNMVRAFCY